MLSVHMPVACSSPDGYIAIQARSGSYGSLMDDAETQIHSGKANLATADAAKAADNGSPEEISAFAKDAVGPLRSASSSGKSILKQSSEELDRENSERIKRTVSWHDWHGEGNNLHTVREYTPE